MEYNKYSNKLFCESLLIIIMIGTGLKIICKILVYNANILNFFSILNINILLFKLIFNKIV